MNGRLITFEGGEGSGKSTQSKLLFRAFDNGKIKAIKTREPGGTDQGEEIRNILVNGSDYNLEPETELLLNFAARKEHIEKLIKPSIKKGYYVISDRFYDSSYAYQGSAYGLGFDYFSNLKTLTIGSFTPDLTIYLDIDVKSGLKRANRRAETNKYEALDTSFHERVRKGFLELSEIYPERIVKIDAKANILAIHRKILGEVNRRFGLKLKPETKV